MVEIFWGIWKLTTSGSLLRWIRVSRMIKSAFLSSNWRLEFGSPSGIALFGGEMEMSDGVEAASFANVVSLAKILS